MTTKIPVELSSTPSIVDNGDATAITIDSSERVGIGTTNPPSKLTVSGSDGGKGIELQVSTGSVQYLMAYDRSASDYIDMQIDAENLRFGTNTGAERMRINSTGLIGIGTTAPVSNGGVNAGLIHLHGGSSDWAILHATTNTTGSASANGGLLGVISDDIYIWNYDSDGIIKFGTNSTTVGEFVANGDFYTNDGTVHSLSDKRIKKNITPLAEGLNLVKKLNPVNFEYCNTYTDDFNGIGTNDGQIHKGFIADEVQEVAPSYVKERTGIVLGKEVDNLKSLSMTEMIPMLVKAIQEQQAIIEDLQTQINEVKNGN